MNYLIFSPQSHQDLQKQGENGTAQVTLENVIKE